MRFKNFYLTEADKEYLGYKIVNYDGTQAYSIADKNVKYSLKKGTVEVGNIYLGTTEKYASAYYSTESSDPDDPQELLMVYKFSKDDIKKGNLEDKDQLTGGSEIVVKKAKLVSVYNITKKEYITEMPKIVAGSQDDWSRSEQHWLNNVDLYKNSTLVKEYKKDFTYRITKDMRGNLDIFCLNPNESGSPIVVGLLQFRKEFPIKKYKYPKISWVAVHPDFRNKNIGTGLYSTAIAHFGGLVSDSSLTKSKEGGSQNIWKLLAKVYNVYAYDGKLFKELDCNDIDSDEYNSYDMLFVVSDKPIKGAIRDD
jgi:GNAT superfamily N-acetyltransferase